MYAILMATMKAPKNTGKKPCQKKQNRKRKQELSGRNETGTYTDKVPLSTSEGTFNLRWLADCKAQVCYGCGGKLRPGPSGIPAPPHDVVLTTMEFRCWYDKASQNTKISTKPERTHYHLNPACVWQKTHFG
ncbi:hypothetical protein AC249_AIPGENE12149 [Exaiptasia diaphana]|nr:hypothetical protein AC249_AIPGENE12149 [Exaiptasia diaphana]